MCSNSPNDNISSNFLSVINDDGPRFRSNSCNSTLRLSLNPLNILNDESSGIPRSNSYSGLRLNSPILNITNDTFTTIISNLRRNNNTNLNNEYDKNSMESDLQNMDVENEKVFNLLCKQGTAVPFLK